MESIIFLYQYHLEIYEIKLIEEIRNIELDRLERGNVCNYSKDIGDNKDQ